MSNEKDAAQYVRPTPTEASEETPPTAQPPAASERQALIRAALARAASSAPKGPGPVRAR